MNSIRFWKGFQVDCVRFFVLAAVIAGLCQPAAAATLYVKPGGAPGHYATIGAAVNQAAAGDTIYVAPGVYREDVIIGTSISLAGAGRGRSIINAANLPNGIYINGIAHPGLSKVVVTGLTVENANFEGILVANASFITLWDNRVSYNDRVLNPSAATCPKLPNFETSEGEDCYANVVIDNDLTNNGLPGVALHNHEAPGPGDPAVNLNDNVIADNRISGNAADTADAATPGPTGINIFGLVPITGTIISGNVIDGEQEGIVAKTPAPAQLNVHLNDLVGARIGVDNLSTGTVDATENWWGSPGGPGTRGATTVSGPGISFTPWLTYPIPARSGDRSFR